MKTERETIIEVLESARTIQEFLWGDMNTGCDIEEYKRMFRKRVAKLDAITADNPHWRVEMKKRLLQTAAVAVNLITQIDNGTIDFDTPMTIESNLPEFAVTPPTSPTTGKE